jgi:hypothetical protein
MEAILPYVSPTIPSVSPEMRVSISELNKLLRNYKIPQRFKQPKYAVDREMLTKLAGMIVVYRIHLGPDSEHLATSSIKDWSAHHVDGFLKVVFDGTAETGEWDLKTGKPTLWVLKERSVPYQPVGKCIPKPMPTHMREATQPDRMCRSIVDRWNLY